VNTDDPGRIREQVRRTHAGAAHRFEFAVALLWIVVLIGGGLAGAAVFDRLSSAMDPAPGSESLRARATVQRATGAGEAILVLIKGVATIPVNETVIRLRAVPGVQAVLSSAEGQLPPPDGGGALLGISLTAPVADAARTTTVDAVRALLDRYPAGQVQAAGYPIVDREVATTAEADLIFADLVALPLVMILLGFVLPWSAWP
jgi:hypothetical protein